MTQITKTNFEDKSLRFWAVTILSIPATFLFTYDSGEGWHLLADYLSFVLGFWLIWEVNRYIIMQAYARMPERDQLRRRLSIQMGIGIPMSVLIGGSVFLFHVLIIKGVPWAQCPFWEEFKELLLPIMMVSLCVNALYESYFLNQLWQASMIEAEQYKKANLEAKFQHLKEQVNPHFLFNSLNTLATLIEEKPKRAVAFVEKLAEVYRYLLSYQDHEVVLLAKEVDFARSYLFLLKMRFEENLQLTLDIPESYLNQSHIPPLTLQMLIENAIKHNEIRRDKPLHIRIGLENDRLVVENSLQKKVASKSLGLGLENIRQRYQFLTQTKVMIQETVEAFTVKLPILYVQQS